MSKGFISLMIKYGKRLFQNFDKHSFIFQLYKQISWYFQNFILHNEI